MFDLEPRKIIKQNIIQLNAINGDTVTLTNDIIEKGLIKFTGDKDKLEKLIEHDLGFCWKNVLYNMAIGALIGGVSAAAIAYN